MLKQILIYGDSIFLSGLTAQLQTWGSVTVYHKKQQAGSLNLGDFDAVVVDFNNVPAADVLAILRARPNLQVIGVNTPGGTVTVLSGQVYLTHSLADIMAYLEAILSDGGTY